MIDQSALQFCARKVAATSGDARKALDVCRRAVEIVETNNTNAKPLLGKNLVIKFSNLYSFKMQLVEFVKVLLWIEIRF